MESTNTPPDLFWNEHFNQENIIEYAQAAREVSSYLRVLAAEGYHSLVVPSRGALPILRAAEQARHLKNEKLSRQSVDNRYRTLAANIEFPTQTILPFSADPVMETANQSHAAIRRYWSHVLAAIIRREGNNPYLLAYQAFNEQLTGRQLHDILPRYLPNEPFVFIDTVVSGQAISEIVSAFEEIGLEKYYLLLLVHDEGKIIDKKSKDLLTNLEAKDKCTLIQIKNLFTEDRGPAVSGVWSTVYPQFHRLFQESFKWEIYGAGSYYIKVASPKDAKPGDPTYNLPVTTFYATLSTAIFTALSGLNDIISQGDTDRIDLTALSTEENGKWDVIKSIIDIKLTTIRAEITKNPSLKSILKQETTQMLAQPRVLQSHRPSSVEKISVSRSHLVRVEFNDEFIKETMRNIENSMRTVKNVLDDDWFIN